MPGSFEHTAVLDCYGQPGKVADIGGSDKVGRSTRRASGSGALSPNGVSTLEGAKASIHATGQGWDAVK